MTSNFHNYDLISHLQKSSLKRQSMIHNPWFLSRNPEKKFSSASTKLIISYLWYCSTGRTLIFICFRLKSQKCNSSHSSQRSTRIFVWCLSRWALHSLGSSSYRIHKAEIYTCKILIWEIRLNRMRSVCNLTSWQLTQRQK